MTEIAPTRKTIARAAVAAFGGTPSVRRYWDDRHVSHVSIVRCDDSPTKGITSYATVGVSDVPLFLDGRELPVRAELVGACATTAERFPNCLATAAFFTINSGRPLAPGILLPDVFRMYAGLSKTMAHFLFVPPFLWEGRLQTLTLDSGPVAWLLVVPISEAEGNYALAHGVPALESVLEREAIDLFDLDRPSVV